MSDWAFAGIMKAMNKPLQQEPAPRERYVRSGWDYIREGLVRAHRRRPVSFYLLLAMPVALVYAASLLDRSDPRQFATALCLLFAFFGVVMIRAVSDLFDLTREWMRGHRASFRDMMSGAALVETTAAGAKDSARD
ncbi:MAG: hypothetical protein RLZZ303_3388 [Candidatus Hydrogenedentota bacterium]